jgi:hypothetical protein
VDLDDDAQGGMTLTEEERARILRRLHSALGWVGVKIPEEALLRGKRVELKDLVDRYVFDDFIDDEERAEVAELMDMIEERADFLEDELRAKDMTRAEAERMFSQAMGLCRAVDELEHLEDADEWELKHRSVIEQVDDMKRWDKFTKKVYKKDEYY